MKGILLGRIINTNGCEVFVEGGGIPKQNVLRIEGEKEEYVNYSGLKPEAYHGGAVKSIGVV